jgi:hypothetical protein
MTPEEIESERQDYFQKAIETWGTEEELVRRFGEKSFGAHEAFDRTWILYENIECYLLKHPTIIMDKEAFDKVYKAFDLLLEVYNRCGIISITATSTRPPMTAVLH